jgi:cell wall-associated NlpC family hydrolase
VTVTAKASAAAAAFLLALVVLAAAAASAVTAAATAPLAALWHAVTGNPAKTEQTYTPEQYLRLIAAAENKAPSRAAATAIAFAARQIGLPYIWGGNGQPGYDCSGLTEAAYAVAGIDIPRVATDQFTQGVKVELQKIEPGDLVYYGSPGFAHHVAIYLGRLGGAGVVLDAPRPGEVIRLDPLAADDLFAATRPAPAEDAVRGTPPSALHNAPHSAYPSPSGATGRV